MLSLNLPEWDENAKPAFADSNSCARWISQFQLTDIRQAHQTLSFQLAELNRTFIPPIARLKITEQLRDTVSIVQGGYAKKIFNKPLPLDEYEFSVLLEIISLWDSMWISYAHCLQAGMNDDQGVIRHLALITQRCLRYAGLQIVEYLLMQHQVDHRLWQMLHQLYGFAEERGFADFPVLESLRLYPPPASCVEHYVQILLISQADPYELPRKQFRLVNRWLDEWRSMVHVNRKLPANAKETPPLAVDLESAENVLSEIPSAGGSSVRYLDVTDLSKSLRIKIALLQQGKLPSQLGLGEDLPPSICLGLVEKLHRHWCEGQEAREFERRSISHKAEVCFGLPDLHYRISGKEFTQPGSEIMLSLRQHDEIAVFGHVVTRAEFKPLHATESWEILDEATKDFSLMRGAMAIGQRVSLGHLVGIFSAEEEGYVPGVIRWVIAGLDGSVNMGVKKLEGRPETVSVRNTGVNLTVSTRYVQAILMHYGDNSSLIIPSGWFSPGKVVQVMDDEGITMELKLMSLVGKGADYERATFIQL
ncbi:MAG: hypothetical protein HKL98_02550 [Burkholderiales bacterium]|nr:hypothetical protein [Burkholderiales bacterium]